jgi:hypothetical protein
MAQREHVRFRSPRTGRPRASRWRQRPPGRPTSAPTTGSSTAARSRWARSHGPLLVPLGNARLCSGQVVDNRYARGSTGRRRRAASSPRGARPAWPSAGPMPRRPTEATRQRSARPARPAGGLGRRRRRGRTPMPFPGRAPPRWSASQGPGRALFPPARGALRRFLLPGRRLRSAIRRTS